MSIGVYVKALQSNLSLKITAFIIGYSLWALLSAMQVTHVTYQVPVSFYNVSDEYALDAPNMFEVTLAGNRAYLRALTAETLSLHIDSSKLTVGENHLIPTAETLFLPEQIAVVHCHPARLIVHVNPRSQSNASLT